MIKNVKVFKPGINQDDYVFSYEGQFLGWGVGMDTYYSGGQVTTKAIVMKSDGSVDLVHPNYIRFIIYPESTDNNKTKELNRENTPFKYVPWWQPFYPDTPWPYWIGDQPNYGPDKVNPWNDHIVFGVGEPYMSKER